MHIDILWCILSLVLTTFFHIRGLLVRLWPYLALLVSFGLFVFLNGGVVLGEQIHYMSHFRYSHLTSSRRQIQSRRNTASFADALYLVFYGVLLVTTNIPDRA